MTTKSITLKQTHTQTPNKKTKIEIPTSANLKKSTKKHQGEQEERAYLSGSHQKPQNPRPTSRKKPSLRGRESVCVKLKLRLDILARWWGVIGQIEVGAEVGARVRMQMAKNLHHCSKITGPVLLLGHHLVPYPIVVPVVVRVTHLSLSLVSLSNFQRPNLCWRALVEAGECVR